MNPATCLYVLVLFTPPPDGGTDLQRIVVEHPCALEIVDVVHKPREPEVGEETP